MKYWWVNQNQTYDYEISGFLWSPKTKSDGGRNPFYETMTQVSPGDLVFSYSDTYIKAIGVVQTQAVTSPKPDFREAGSNWANEGWYVEVEFKEITDPIKPKDFMHLILPHLANKYAPLLPNGRGLQGIYLTEISEAFGQILIDLSNENLNLIKENLAPIQNLELEEEIKNEIKFSQIEGNLEKIQLIKSRRGQGIFKANVRLIENKCRITGVSNIKHLIASHIKPWKESNEEEKIDGFNGFLMSPHIDHLFNYGFLSFENNGNLMISKFLNPLILNQWKISEIKNVGNFRDEQKYYLDFHREKVFNE